MKCPSLVLLPLLVLGCASTKALDSRQPSASGEEVHITPDELEPIGRFVLETKRVLVAEFVRVEISRQFFYERMAITRDQRSVTRKESRFDRQVGRYPAGTTRIELTNTSTQQENLNPDFLPKITFGSGGLQIRAYRKLVIYVVPAMQKQRPLYIDVLAKMSTGYARLWTGGRLTDEKPEIRVIAELLWSEDKEEYKHVASVG
jgi:hypothetical protein